MRGDGKIVARARYIGPYTYPTHPIPPHDQQQPTVETSFTLAARYSEGGRRSPNPGAEIRPHPHRLIPAMTWTRMGAEADHDSAGEGMPRTQRA